MRISDLPGNDLLRLSAAEKLVLIVDGALLLLGLTAGGAWVVLRLLGSDLPESLTTLRDYGVVVFIGLLVIVLVLGLQWKVRVWLGRRSRGSTRL
jgi:hypothetical protein